MGGETLTFPVDVANAEQLDAVASLVEEKWGPIDVWVNNAMVTALGPVKDIAPEEHRRVMEVTYLGTFTALKRSKRPQGQRQHCFGRVGNGLQRHTLKHRIYHPLRITVILPSYN
ncbi:SDR family NAD(P)-dependent oxidoreductase [Pontibacter pamirensis]|uniref:SDR family NAD(P)-dependent oxidoreductase n=1 Tax=Pontibacter pamirensis TaxID=2562824 RepID=UPI001F1AB27B|nr:SDR family NAD(P)-dependent oxidoreductase [Pontibacter pamirensis]